MELEVDAKLGRSFNDIYQLYGGAKEWIEVLTELRHNIEHELATSEQTTSQLSEIRGVLETNAGEVQVLLVEIKDVRTDTERIAKDIASTYRSIVGDRLRSLSIMASEQESESDFLGQQYGNFGRANDLEAQSILSSHLSERSNELRRISSEIAALQQNLKRVEEPPENHSPN